MPMPKSVTKINKNGVTYTSSVDRVQYTIKELERAALRDVAKVLRYKGKQNAPKKEGNYKKNIATWVRKNNRTRDVRLQFGVYNTATARRKGKPPAGFYAHILEFGSRTVRGLHILRNTVYNNISLIIQTQSRYLSALENEAKARSLIDESEEVSDE